jgi:hypothetical protein
MSDWQRNDTIEGNGYFWENAALGISAFEDASEGYSQWYAWKGTADDGDAADQTDVHPTLDEAVAELLGR